MNVLVLGGTGMLGHQVWQVFSKQIPTFVTIRGSRADCPHASRFDPSQIVEDVDATNFPSVERALDAVQPGVVINCIGVVKQHPQANDPLTAIGINAYFPHLLAKACGERDCRLIHVSTDCVFSGKRGGYSEDDIPDPVDVYGQTKLLGEVAGPNCLTLRTSLIGRELTEGRGVIEWFLKQHGNTIKGYRQMIFTGMTTQVFAEILLRVVLDHPRLTGICHVAAEPISKFDLLCLVRALAGIDVAIEPDDSYRCDRTLNGQRFFKQTGLAAPPWEAMIEEMLTNIPLASVEA